MALFEIIILLLIVAVMLYNWLTAKYHVLRERGIPHVKPRLFIGSMDWRLLMGQTSLMRVIIARYLKNIGSKVYGTYSFRNPVFIIRDVELLRQIAIKDFKYFPNHEMANKFGGSVLEKGLVVLKNSKWKQMRAVLAPSFTSSKMRLMYGLINECSLEGVKYIEQALKMDDKQFIDLEMKEYFTKFTNDVIASTAFGIKVNSFRDKSNEFYTIGSSLTQFRGFIVLKMLLYGLMPKIMKALRVQIFDQNKINYFKSLVFDAVEYRRQHNIIRTDMIQLLMEAKRDFDDTKATEKNESTDFTDDDLLAQCLLFFVAGFETVSTCLCFTTYELAINQDVQQRLYEEILQVEQERNGKPLDYDTLMKMNYMDMVLSESLRKWPPVMISDRLCATDYKLKDENGHLITEIKQNEVVFIPIVAYHHDPEYFPDPEKFDPERFSTQLKQLINPMAYLPFGVGPRSCIGNRFALMETKSIIYHMLLRFRIERTEKTAKDMMNSIKSLRMTSSELFWVKLVSRK